MNPVQRSSSVGPVPIRQNNSATRQFRVLQLPQDTQRPIAVEFQGAGDQMHVQVQIPQVPCPQVGGARNVALAPIPPVPRPQAEFNGNVAPARIPPLARPQPQGRGNPNEAQLPFARARLNGDLFAFLDPPPARSLKVIFLHVAISVGFYYAMHLNIVQALTSNLFTFETGFVFLVNSVLTFAFAYCCAKFINTIGQRNVEVVCMMLSQLAITYAFILCMDKLKLLGPCLPKVHTRRTFKVTNYFGNWLTYTKVQDEYQCMFFLGNQVKDVEECSGWSIGGAEVHC